MTEEALRAIEVWMTETTAPSRTVYSAAEVRDRLMDIYLLASPIVREEATSG